MSGPLIERKECFDRDAVSWTLTVPSYWLVSTRWPRLQLAWWLVKLAVQDWRAPKQAE